MAPERVHEFANKGLKQRQFFPHRLYYLRKPGPGAVRLSDSMCGNRNQNSQWQILLHGTSPNTDEFPRGLFFDDDIVWHRNHYDLDAHIAFAFLVVDGERMFGLNYVSDVVQRITRRRDLKTRTEKVFQGWACMLLNGALNLAVELGVRTFFSPTADLVLAHSRPAGRELFERIYDRTPAKLFRVRPEGRWWRIDVEENRDRLVKPKKYTGMQSRQRILCLVHDVAVSQPAFGPALAGTLHGEMGLPTTYIASRRNYTQWRDLLAGRPACLAFGPERDDPMGRECLNRELQLCRETDKRTRGYRLPGARMPVPAERYELCHQKFDWLIVGQSGDGSTTPEIKNGLATIPVSVDDRNLTPAGFRSRASVTIRAVERQDEVVTVRLGRNWWQSDPADRRALLDEMLSRRTPMTCDQLTNHLVLSRAL